MTFLPILRAALIAMMFMAGSASAHEGTTTGTKPKPRLWPAPRRDWRPSPVRSNS